MIQTRRPFSCSRFVAASVVIASLVLPAMDTAAASPDPSQLALNHGSENVPIVVDYDERRGELKIIAVDVPLTRVLGAVEEATGVKVVIHGTNHEIVNLNFDHVPIDEGLRRILARSNHVIFRSEDHARIVKVWVLTSGDTDGAGSQPRSTVSKRGSTTPRANPPSSELSANEVVKMLEQLESQTQGAAATSDTGRRLIEALRGAAERGLVPENLPEMLESQSRQGRNEQ